ncbi:HTH-type transcriptional regulator McbR [mine drainage metagenome]|uniref:HTH-type transcriptional regulator McbR n=1 Tax=mine drainage metagenome TaxID=410659 RepID=A0A1J5QH29_9ZZZZ
MSLSSDGQETLRERLLAEVRASIIAGQMAPGELYSAPFIAALYEVSVTPVREALLDLVKEGLLTPVRNKGFRVVEPTDEDLDEIAKVRDLLEPAAVAEVARNATNEQLARLRELAAEIARYARQGSIEEYLQADRNFHLAVIEATGNSRLVEIIARLRGQARLFGLKKIAEAGQLEASSRDHDDLLAAIEARDPERAEEIMRAHLGHVRTDWR